MKRYIESVSQDQGTLFPDHLDDWTGDENVVRVIDAFVDELDLRGLGFELSEAMGRPGYHPSVLLKLYIYGYLNRVQSSRRLERETLRNVEVMWLLGRLSPDHKTIANFRKDNGAAIRKMCAQFVELCREIGLLAVASVAIDDSKFKAVNNRDQNITWEEPKDCGIAMVFHSYALYPRMSVRRNLSFGLEMAKTPKPEIERRVSEAAATLQIDHLLDRRPDQLSCGQRQRVAIGRALVRDANVFLFDEPLSNLDAQLRNDLRVEIKRLHQRLDATMIYVTHDQIEALILADRIAVMQDQAIQQLGTPAEIYHRFVAGFVGSSRMNFLDGTLGHEAGEVVFTTGERMLPVGGYDFKQQPEPGQKVTLGIRPEHLEVGAGGPCGIDGLAIDMIEPMGADNLIWFRDESLSLGVRLSGETALKERQTAPLTLPIDQLSLFSTEHGTRL